MAHPLFYVQFQRLTWFAKILKRLELFPNSVTKESGLHVIRKLKNY
jgi:hypothetical protein